MSINKNYVQWSLLSLSKLIKIMFNDLIKVVLNEFNKVYVKWSLLSLSQLIKVMFNEFNKVCLN